MSKQICKTCGSEEVARCKWVNVNNNSIYNDADSGTTLEWCFGNCQDETTIIDAEDMPMFLWIDKTRRGETGNMTLPSVIEDAVDENDDELREWAERAEIGDSYQNSTNSYIRTH